MKIKVQIFASQDPWQKQPVITASTYDMSDMGYVKIDEQFLEVDIPASFSLQSFQLKRLAKEKEAVIQKFQQTIARIDDEVKKYQCLEMSQSD